MFGNTLARVGYTITVAIWLVAIPFIIITGIQPLLDKKVEEPTPVINYFFSDDPVVSNGPAKQEPTVTARVIFGLLAAIASIVLIYFVGSWSSVILRKFMRRLRIKISSTSILIVKIAGLALGALLMFLPFAMLHSIAEPYIFVAGLASIAAICFVTQHILARITKQPIKKLL